MRPEEHVSDYSLSHVDTIRAEKENMPQSNNVDITIISEMQWQKINCRTTVPILLLEERPVSE